MDVDVLIIGQGICGTFLSWYLQNTGLSFFILDKPITLSASKAAAGLINPITGRRLVKTWMIDELMPFARGAYDMIGKELGIDCLCERSIIDFFPSPQMRNAFLERIKEEPNYLHMPEDEQVWNTQFRYGLGFGRIEPCLLVDLPKILLTFRKNLIANGKLLEERFHLKELIPGQEDLWYKDIHARKIIFCDGIESFANPYFNALPFAPNKGEALILDIPDLPAGYIFKRGINIIPWRDGLFWVGSSYEWNFADDRPSAIFHERTQLFLKEWLRLPFSIIDHLSSVRPAAVERRPFVGFHPVQQNMGILNGMGTKACSLAPFFANQLAGNLVSQIPIMPEVDIHRFGRLLSRTPTG